MVRRISAFAAGCLLLLLMACATASAAPSRDERADGRIVLVISGPVGAVVVSVPEGIVCPPRCEFLFGQPHVTLTVNLAAGMVFVGWRINGAPPPAGACGAHAPTDTTCDLTLAAERTEVTAVVAAAPKPKPDCERYRRDVDIVEAKLAALQEAEQALLAQILAVRELRKAREAEREGWLGLKGYLPSVIDAITETFQTESTLLEAIGALAEQSAAAMRAWEQARDALARCLDEQGRSQGRRAAAPAAGGTADEPAACELEDRRAAAATARRSTLDGVVRLFRAVPLERARKGMADAVARLTEALPRFPSKAGEIRAAIASAKKHGKLLTATEQALARINGRAVKAKTAEASTRAVHKKCLAGK